MPMAPAGYCFRPTVTVTPAPQVCPEGCYCLQEAEAKAKFGPDNYTRCTGGYLRV